MDRPFILKDDNDKIKQLLGNKSNPWGYSSHWKIGTALERL